MTLSEEKLATGRHWDNIYNEVEEEQLGWYEEDFSPTFKLLSSAKLNKSGRVVIAGSGNSSLADQMLEKGFRNICVTDISEVALAQLASRLSSRVSYVVDDLSNPVKLNGIGPVELWFDRAALHFLTLADEKIAYRSLIEKLVSNGGYVALAQFAEDGATICSGLKIKRYSVDELEEFLGEEFGLVDSFRHLYTMPNGDTRLYNYALFKRLNVPG